LRPARRRTRARGEGDRAWRHAARLAGVIINSHTRHEYLNDPKFWAIFEAAEALGVPVYLHPNTPSKGMIQPLVERGLDGAIYGFGVETGMHALTIITAGVFDAFETSWCSAPGEALLF
jgi:predicted TIM-barrel fold metal-dependent hydrolase